MPLSLNYKFLLIASATSAAATTIISLALAHTLWYNYEVIPLMGRNSIASFLTSASMLSSFIITFMITKATRNAIRSQQIYPLHWHLKSQTLIDQLPRHTVHRAFILGIIGALMSGLTIYLLQFKGFTSFYFSQFVGFSIMYFVLLPTAVAVMSAYRAMGDDVMKQVKL
ncbi:hypothetical protein H8S84_02510 [Pontibacter sp. SD6]|uniref:FtsX-like permease family protein n=2 Tax=Pontibacter cellulosilyticus TaxID=1720253 RepID=A0A923SHM5_9BACT|nr:hypothetical protein [Pontibacter cellulosilyticus]